MNARPRVAPTLAVLLLAGSLSGCASPRYLGRTSGELREGSARCRVGSGRSNPLVTEWPASEKANLEALLRRGGVVVEYQGCSMRVLTQCRLGGHYAWQRTTPSSDTIEINDEDELYAKLPLGAASLEGDLKRSGKLTVYTAVAGQYRLEDASSADVGSVGECARATHVVGGLAAGAFSLDGSGTASAKADVDFAKIGSAGARSSRSTGLKRAAGNWEACSEGTEAAPHPDCRSPIQVFLWPIPGRATSEGPPGTVKVDLISAEPSIRWDVYYDDEVVCSTPCSRWLDPARPLHLRTRDQGPFATMPDRLQVRDLEPAAGSGALQLYAHPTSQGQRLAGWAFAGLGIAGGSTGLMLMALGCPDRPPPFESQRGLCTGGAVTALVSGLVAAGATWLIVDSRPKVELVPGGAPGRSFTVSVGPGGVAGSF